MADEQLSILIDVRSRLDELTKTQQEIRKLGDQVTSTGQAMKTGLGVEVMRRGLDFLTEGFKESVVGALEMATEIKRGSRNLEMSTDAYQVLGRVIREAGGDMAMLNEIVSHNNRSLVEARNSTSAAAIAYRTLRLNSQQLENLPTEKRFEAIGKAISQTTDRAQVFSSASQILGARNLPILLGSLQMLATEGYGKVEAAAKSAGQVMAHETVELLADANKRYEEFLKVTVPIAAGGALQAANGVMEWIGSAAGNWLNAMQGLSFSTFDKVPEKTLPKAEINAPDNTPLNKTPEWLQTQLELLKAQNGQTEINNDQTATEIAKKADLIPLLWNEIYARKALLDLASNKPLRLNETQLERDMLIQQLETEKNLAILRKLNLTDAKSAWDRKRTQPGYGNPNQVLVGPSGKRESANPNYLSPSEGIHAGFGDWVTSLGSSGEQIANSLRSTIGNTVSGISDGIYGWITGTKSFGQSIAQLGGTIFKTLLDTIVQMGVQWLVTQATIKGGMLTLDGLTEMLRAKRTAATAAEGASTAASMAPAAAASSIASFGTADILGVIGVVAALASITALFGGFREAGGDVQAGRPYIVGERRAELFVPNQSGRILPNVGALGMPSRRGVGSVGGSAPNFGGMAGGTGSRESARNTYLLMDRAQYARIMQEDMSAYFREIAASEMRRGA